MIKRLIKAVLKLLINLTTTLMSPIDDFINQILPDLSTALSAVGSFFTLALDCLGFCVQLLGLSSTAISLIILYYTIKLTYPITFALVKLGIKWYNALKL